VFVTRAEAQGLADQPTRALGLAGRLVHDPDSLGEALVALLDAAQVSWRPEGTVVLHGYDEQRMTLTDPAGGFYEVLRPAPAFTPAEYARAQALVEVGAALLRPTAQRTTLLLPDGAELLVRAAGDDDAPGIRRLHLRGSAPDRRQHLAGVRVPTSARLRGLLDPAAGVTMLALHADPARDEERVVATGHLLVEGDRGEIALLVDEGWQRRGVGTALLRRLLTAAGRLNVAAVVARAAAENVALLRTLRRFGMTGPGVRDGRLLTLTLPVAGRRPAGTDTPAAFG
jgi:GNAT superfamily N-acetyltransferase